MNALVNAEQNFVKRVIRSFAWLLITIIVVTMIMGIITSLWLWKKLFLPLKTLLMQLRILPVTHSLLYIRAQKKMKFTMFGYIKGVEWQIKNQPAPLCHPLSAVNNPLKSYWRVTINGNDFVGGNDTYREDHGFAIHPWTKVRFENVANYIHGDYAVAMGNHI